MVKRNRSLDSFFPPVVECGVVPFVSLFRVRQLEAQKRAYRLAGLDRDKVLSGGKKRGVKRV